jgi:hypothetical protein
MLTEIEQYAQALNMRLGQFLFNVMQEELPRRKDMFHVPDAELLEAARRYYNTNKEWFGKGRYGRKA